MSIPIVLFYVFIGFVLAGAVYKTTIDEGKVSIFRLWVYSVLVVLLWPMLMCIAIGYVIASHGEDDDERCELGDDLSD